MTSRAAFTSSTVPAPIKHPLSSGSAASPAIVSSAPGVVSVISTAVTPPAASAVATPRRLPDSGSRTTAITPLASQGSVMSQRSLHALALEYVHPACRGFDEVWEPRRFRQRLDWQSQERQVCGACEREALRRAPAPLPECADEGHDPNPHFRLLIRQDYAPLVIEPRVPEAFHDRLGEIVGRVARQVGGGDDLVEQHPPQERAQARVLNRLAHRPDASR